MTEEMTSSPPATRHLDSCAICGSEGLVELWSLPKYPFTESFGDFDPLFPAPNQALMACYECGHAQLQEQVDPSWLYSRENYHYVPSKASKFASEYDYLESFIRRVIPSRSPALIVEFGANNLDFARYLSGIGKSVLVCDPLLPDQSQETDFIFVTDTIEAAAASGRLGRPDLIVARHTLEHIGDPVPLLSSLFEVSVPDAILVFEVPSFEHLVAKQRFDAITHQHVHYFNRSSVRHLADRLDAHVIDWAFNPFGSNGGSLMFALARSSVSKMPTLTGPLDVSNPTAIVRATEVAVSSFRQQMAAVDASVDWDNGRTFGYGASLMLATLDYHLHGRLSYLPYVFDDAPERAGATYKNVNVSVLGPNDPRFDANGTFIITSWENSRAIYRRLTELGVGRIVSPVLS